MFKIRQDANRGTPERWQQERSTVRRVRMTVCVIRSPSAATFTLQRTQNLDVLFVVRFAVSQRKAFTVVPPPYEPTFCQFTYELLILVPLYFDLVCMHDV